MACATRIHTMRRVAADDEGVGVNLDLEKINIVGLNYGPHANVEGAMFKTYSLAVACTVVLCGCGAVPKAMLKDYGPAPLSTQPPSSSDLLQLLKTGGNGLPRIDEKCFVVPLSNAADVALCTVARNAAIKTLRMRSNDLCIAHRSTMYGNEAVANITLGTLTNFASGAAAVVTHPATKTGFAALALFANSERSLVNETVYKQMLVPAIDAKILQVRATAAAGLDAKLVTDAASYTLLEAISDIEVYHISCSFMDGLQLALKEGTQPAEVVKETRLRNNMAVLSTQMALIPNAERTGTQKDVYGSMVQRYQAMSSELQKLEAR